MKRDILWVTGFSESYYNAVGKITLGTWNFLTNDHIFFSESRISHKGTIYIGEEMKNYHPDLQNKIFNESKKTYKFFKKAFCIWYALKNYQDKYKSIIWLDTDVLVKKPFDVNEFLPNQDQIFSTIIHGQHGCDSGFVAFNTDYPDFDKFVDEYIDYYLSGRIYQMHNPWDAYILEDFSKRMPVKNLFSGKPSKEDCGFQNTLLDPYLDHYWGKKGKIELESKS
jgi:hypothetical protein